MNANFFLPSFKPTIFSLPQSFSPQDIEIRLNSRLIDTYSAWLEELFQIRYPHKDKHDLEEYIQANSSPYAGKWAYYPWKNETIHIPDMDEFREVFFSRNYPIIEKEVQNRLWDMQIGSAGLSVGSNIAIELVKAGVHKFKLADYDTLAPSNNNRITGGNIFQIGENKTYLLAKKLYELNPYCDIELFPEGLNERNFKKFVQNCDILIDEIDAFPIKNLFRDYIHSEEGKNTILLTGADLGESPIVEIEAHNDPKFGGRVNNKDIQFILQGNPNKIQSTRMLVSVVGRDNIPSSFLQNFINIKRGEQTYWAQLGLAATAVGAKIAGMVIEIARGNAEKLNRLSQLHLREINHPEEKRISDAFNKEFGYLPAVKRTIFMPDEAELKVHRTDAEQNGLEIEVGKLKISIKEIQGNKITDEELEEVHKARHSYKMWGDDVTFLLDDPTDRIWEEGMYETKHLIASVTGENFFKTYVLKKTYISFEQLKILAQQNALPFEFAVWNLKNTKTDHMEKVWNIFSNHSKRSIAINSRFCTFSEHVKKNGIEKKGAPITFAAMQLFTSESISPDYIFNIITPEALKKIFSIGYQRKKIALQFDSVDKTLGLQHWKTILDDNPTVDLHKAKLPKYWAQNPMLFITEADIWRKSAITLLKAAKEKYK